MNRNNPPNGEYPTAILDLPALRAMKEGKQFDDLIRSVNSISYSKNGLKMLVSTDDDSIFLYDLTAGQLARSVNSKKYGAAHVKFASGDTCAILSSTKVDHTIRYLSLSDNKYIRYFRGHTDHVTGLSMSPNDDMFLSVSNDKTIRLWELGTSNCMGIMNISTTAIAAFDPEGLIFAAGMGSNIIKLYDLRSFDKGPFSSFAMPQNVTNMEWTSMKFSPCGKFILICTKSNRLLLIDAFTGTVKSVLQGHQNRDNAPLEASFTPDSKFVVCGSSDSRIYTYSTTDGSIVQIYSTSHDNGGPLIVEWNPVFVSFASADKKLRLWTAGPEINPMST